MVEQSNFSKVFSAACLGMLLFGVVIITLGSILPYLVANFQLDGIKAGTLTSLLPFGILLGSLLFGPIVDRYSYKYLLIICALLVMVGIETIAFTHDIYILQLSVLIIGLGGGAINGGTNALVADISASSSRGRGSNLSLLGVFFGIGALGMPFVLGLFSQFHYRHTLSAVGLLLIVPIVYFAFTRFPRPKQMQTQPVKNILGLVKDHDLLLLGLILFFQSGIEGIISNWTTLYLQNESGFIQDNALYALSLFVLSLTLARVVLTFLLNHMPSYLVLMTSVIIVTGGILCFMFPVLPEREIIGLVLLGAGLAAGFPIVLGYVGALYPNLSGTAFSMVLVIGLSGNILLNFIMGVITKNQGVAAYSLLLLICTICLAGIQVITLKQIASKTKI